MFGATLTVLLLVTLSSGNVRLVDVDKESAAVASVVGHILKRHYPECSLGVGMDDPELLRHLQEMLVWINRPVVISRMDSFQYDPSDYPWVWKPEHLLSFRTQPPELRSRLWPGGSCAFNLILARNISSVPELIMHTAAHFMLRNLIDPVMIHTSDPHPSILLDDPVRGIALKMLSHFSRAMIVHNVCYNCMPSGEDSLNRFTYSAGMDRHKLFPSPPMNMNGKKVAVGFVEDIDVQDARKRKRKEMPLSFEEEMVLYWEAVFNMSMTVVVPEISDKELLANGSLSGIARAVVSGEVDMSGLILFTPISAKAVALLYPIAYLHGGFVTRTPRQDIKWYVIFQPYAPSMWIALLFAVIGTSVVLRFLDQSRSVASHARFMLREFLEQPASRYVRTRTLHGCMSFFALIVVTLYKTRLVTLITFPSPERLPRNAPELLESRMEVGSTFMVSVALSLILEELDNPVYRSLLESTTIVNSIHDCIEATQTTDYACLLVDYLYNRERHYFMDASGNPQTLFWLEKPLNSYTSPCFGRDHVHFQVHDRTIRRTFQGHLFQQLESRINYQNFLNKYFKMLRDNPDSLRVRKGRLLDINKLGNVFYLWMMGMAVSGLWFVVEVCGHRLRDDHVPYRYLK